MNSYKLRSDVAQRLGWKKGRWLPCAWTAGDGAHVGRVWSEAGWTDPHGRELADLPDFSTDLVAVMDLADELPETLRKDYVGQLQMAVCGDACYHREDDFYAVNCKAPTRWLALVAVLGMDVADERADKK